MPATIHTLANGAVGVSKGRAAIEESLVLHRSPPLRVGGEQRLSRVPDPA